MNMENSADKGHLESQNIIVVMGASGSGKTSVGQELANYLGAQFLDGDSFHSGENVNKMKNGIPLTDEDRLNWLQTIYQTIYNHSLNNNRSLVIGCSALKYKYRNILRGNWSNYEEKRMEKLLHHNFNVKFLYLKGSYESLYRRLVDRKSHFMGPNLLKSQLETLEEPLDYEIQDFIITSIDQSIPEIVKYTVNELQK